MPCEIADHRIAGTRISVWDVLHYLDHGWSQQEIAEALELSVDQVTAAVAYINRNRSFVAAVHQQIEERNTRGNPPEVEQKIAEARRRRATWTGQQIPAAPREDGHAGNRRGR